MKNKFCCINCKEEILTMNYERHAKSNHCKKFGIPTSKICRYCNTGFNTIKSSVSHESRCTKNPNKITKAAWNKGKSKVEIFEYIQSKPKKEKDNSKFCCIKCNKEIFTINYNRHISVDDCNNINKCKVITTVCEFCNITFPSIRSCGQHRPYCEKNPDKSRTAWNKDKTMHNDIRLAKTSETRLDRFRQGITKPYIRIWTDADKLKHSEIMSKVAQENPDAYSGRYNRYGVKEKICLNGFRVLGSWEETFVNYCYTNDIQIDQPKVPFSYMFEGKEHHYYPDFYLSEYNLYVEVKGLELEKDVAKWHALTTIHNQRLVVARLDEITAIRNNTFNFFDFISKLYIPDLVHA